MDVRLVLSLSLFIAHSYGDHASILRALSSDITLSGCTQGCVNNASQSAHSPCPDPADLACICDNSSLSAVVIDCFSVSPNCGKRPDDRIAALQEFNEACEDAVLESTLQFQMPCLALPVAVVALRRQPLQRRFPHRPQTTPPQPHYRALQVLYLRKRLRTPLQCLLPRVLLVCPRRETPQVV
ncbi:hypothetical protein C8Q73DRAFT_190747 [Cubamyces lactineus]|nr:hypothetical protein C8Q73DRAFT_190747 [Cubamyces lactineus]